MSAPRRHLLLGIHSPVQQPLHRALGDRRRNRVFAPAGCRLVNDNIGLSGYVCLQIAEKARHLSRGRYNRRRIVSRRVERDKSLANEIERAPDPTMPKMPTDPLDGLGEASAGLALRLRGIGPAHRLIVGEVEPQTASDLFRAPRHGPPPGHRQLELRGTSLLQFQF
jgi:hypothetical protein